MSSLKTLAITALLTLTTASTTSKRGLCYTPNADHPGDNKIWTQSGSDLSWYYNYGASPSSVFSSLSQSDFQFIPMMWGVGSEPSTDTAFLSTVKSLIEGGRNITHVLGFNEPDAPNSWGGSDVEPDRAAKAWVANFEPLGNMGVKLGLPAVTSREMGVAWLKQFLGNCSELVSKAAGTERNCTWDFMPMHCYDSFEGTAAQMGERRSYWPDAEIWFTEWAYADQDLDATESSFNQSVEYFDRLDYVGRYSYFGAFRSYTSNVGPNAAMLNNQGKLTTIGVEYLGVSGTGADVDSAAAGGVGGGCGRAWTSVVGALGAFAWAAF